MLTDAPICSRCGGRAPVAAGACPHCGAPLHLRPARPPTGIRCPACGSTAPPNEAGACASCGLPGLGPSAASDPVAAPAPARRSRHRPLLVGVLVVAVVAVLVGVSFGDAGGIEARWRLQVGDDVVGAPVAEGRNAFLVTAGGALLAVDLADGRARWRFETGERAVGGPIVGGGLVHLATATPGDVGGHVYAVDVRTGEEQWRVPTEAAAEGVASDAGHLHLLADDLVALDAATGEEQWRRPVEGDVGPVVAGSGLVVTVTGGGLAGFDARTGEPRWSWSAAPRPEVAPALSGDRVLTGDGSGALVALDAGRGRELWRVPATALLSHPPAVDGSVVAVATVDGVLAVDPATGRQRWRSGPAGEPRLRVAGGGALVAAATDQLTVLDARSGAVVGRGALPEGRRPPAPVVIDGQVLVARGAVAELWVVP